jgi:hypothetical protein
MHHSERPNCNKTPDENTGKNGCPENPSGDTTSPSEGFGNTIIAQLPSGIKRFILHTMLLPTCCRNVMLLQTFVQRIDEHTGGASVTPCLEAANRSSCRRNLDAGFRVAVMVHMVRFDQSQVFEPYAAALNRQDKKKQAER